MSFTTIHEGAACKTNLFYREGEGLSIERIHLVSKQKSKLRITAEEIEGLIRVWPAFKESLSTAGVESASPATRSPSASKASPEPGSFRSSTREGSLL